VGDVRNLDWDLLLEFSLNKDLIGVVGRALRGPGIQEGWDFEPGARIGYELNKQLDLSLEYYAAVGPLGSPLPGREQVHQFFPGGDLKLLKTLSGISESESELRRQAIA